DPVEVITDPNTKVELLDKDGNVIGSGTTDSTGHATITPTVPIPEGNVTVKATDNAEHPNSSTSDPVKATDTTPPTVPTLDTDLVGKAGTQTPITVTTDPNTHVDLLDKDGNIIGSGTTDDTGHVTITPTKPIPEGNVTVKATDNAEHPNSSVSKPVKATKPTVKSDKKAKHNKTKISKNHNSKEYRNQKSNKSKNTIRGEKKNETNIDGISKNKVKDLPNTGIKETTDNSLPYLVTLLGSFVLLIGRRKDNNRNK
ncbi:hypothetical protein CVS44_10245, partial [Staphylococcus haemolyticus]